MRTIENHVDSRRIRRVCDRVFGKARVRFGCIQQAFAIVEKTRKFERLAVDAAIFMACKVETQSSLRMEKLRINLCGPKKNNERFQKLKSMELELLGDLQWALPMTPLRWAEKMGMFGGSSGNRATEFCYHSTNLLLTEASSVTSHEIAIRVCNMLRMECGQPGSPTSNDFGIQLAIEVAEPDARRASLDIQAEPPEFEMSDSD